MRGELCEGEPFTAAPCRYFFAHVKHDGALHRPLICPAEIVYAATYRLGFAKSTGVSLRANPLFTRIHERKLNAISL